MRNDEDMSRNVNPLRRILRRSWKLPELLRLDELRRVAVVHPAARGRRCVVNVTGIEIDGRLYDFAQAGCEMWEACEKCAFNKPDLPCSGSCPCIPHDRIYGGNSYLRARDEGGSHGKA